jgi:hypothetical protein
MSGLTDTTKILVFNWTTLLYSLQPSVLNGNRFGAACTLLKGSKGETLVAIAGGKSAGLEVWNPADGSVKILNDTFPLSDSGTNSQMIAINGNIELIYYESACADGAPTGIWKFSQVTNAWIRIGNMLQSRCYFSALPVAGVSCP